MPQVSVKEVYDETRGRLGLSWIAGLDGGDKLLTSETVQKPTLALIGHLNFVHPNRVQVLGCAEMDYLRQQQGPALEQAISNLFSTELAAIIVANGESVPEVLIDASNRTQTPLFTSPQASPGLMNILSHHLTQVLAESTTRHGVFLDVMGHGVLITGDSGIGKSELALELITRGYRLVADDMVDLYKVAPDRLEGRCPALLRDFLEVRGLGILNIRALFGETAVAPQEDLRLIVDLKKMSKLNPGEIDRLEISSTSQDILGVEIPQVRIPVAAGRNLAVLVEVAVRNHILLTRGINSTEQFVARHADHLSRNEGS
jgi:Serine kinase of the HPr protein, regulates carbohydrate metabolism